MWYLLTLNFQPGYQEMGFMVSFQHPGFKQLPYSLDFGMFVPCFWFQSQYHVITQCVNAKCRATSAITSIEVI